jgi:hypothetical protein
MVLTRVTFLILTLLIIQLYAKNMSERVVERNTILESIVQNNLTDVTSSTLKLELQIINFTDNILECELKYTNIGKVAIWVMEDPRRADGGKGFYYGIDENDPTTFLISSKVEYGPINYDLSVRRAGVTLRILKPEQEVKKHLQIHFPLNETMPPYGKHVARRTINLSEMKNIQVCIGIVEDNKSIREIGKRKVAPFHFSGYEEIRLKSKRKIILFKAQEIVNSPKIPLIAK